MYYFLPKTYTLVNIMWPHHHGLRKGKYKIIHYFPFNEWEFYDLENDPNEEKI